MYPRQLSFGTPLPARSFFLFGPRQTGKTTLLRSLYPDAMYVDLLDSRTFRDLAARPELLRQRRTPGQHLIVIDEIQRLPGLLNEVQLLLDRDKKVRVILTGSSARGLRQRGVNLLGGRARVAHLFPLVAPEVGYEKWDRRLAVGSLPAVLDSEEPWEDLDAYTGVYLQEEIRAEGLVRSIESFSRFLEVAAMGNGQLLNFTEIGSDAGVPARTVREHYQLLEDTLLGFQLQPYARTRKRKPVATAKFYLFDTGVANCLRRRRTVLPGSTEYGESLEHQIVLECRAYLGYRRIDDPLCFWRSQSKLEVDLVIGDHTAIEVTAAERVSEKKFTGLRAIAEEVRLKRKIVVCREPAPRVTEDGIHVMPVTVFLQALWDGEVLR
ncbi:MAG: ATP-binding protein [Acidobacteria bacterium]|nr:ATP-binding protein [Acidobacteriota bacterium]